MVGRPIPFVIARTIGFDKDNAQMIIWANWIVPQAANDEQEESENE
jgi:hypothetical protein